MSDRNSGETILAFLLGGLIGAVIGILYAPRSGKETRERLLALSDDLGDKLKTFGEEIKEKASKKISDAKEKILSRDNEEELES